jgi:hypothetical protein
VRPDGQSELYDLRRDPQELNNVFGERTYAGEQETLLVRMLNWYVRTLDVVPRGRDSRALPPYSGKCHSVHGVIKTEKPNFGEQDRLKSSSAKVEFQRKESTDAYWSVYCPVSGFSF